METSESALAEAPLSEGGTEHEGVDNNAPETDAWNEFFTAIRPQIFAFVMKMVRNAADAEDIVQKTFERACEKSDTLINPKAVYNWLFTIAYRTTIDHLRSVRSKRDNVSLTDISFDFDGTSKKSDSAPPPDILMDEEIWKVINSSIDALPKIYRDLVRRHYFDDVSIPELSALHPDIAIGTIKSRLHNGRGKLRRIIEERHPEYAENL